MNKASSLALASIFLYAALAATCLYFALCFYDFQTGEFRDGRYSAPKFIFFVVLFCSAVLDIPLFIGCIAEGGPHDCEWEDPSYVVFWLFHLFATCGYIYAIITPAVLWSDIIHQKDGMFWNSAYPVDSTKLFFRVAFVLFCANEFTTVVGAVVMQDPSHFGSFDTNSIGAITDCITPIMTTVITFGCLWAGIELQRYVMNVGLGGGTRNRVLMQLNLTMFLIAATYMYRSLLVLSLYEPIPQQYKDAMHPIRSSFFLWLLGTRWLPAVVCSFCLVNEMRFKGSANTNSRHSQNAVIRASKDLHNNGTGGEHTLYQSLLQAMRLSNHTNNNNNHNDTRGSNSTTRSASHRAVGRRTLSATSLDSASTADSALHETYSMLSSVDFPDSSSESSSTYLLSPGGSPDRVKTEQEALLGRSHDVLISTGAGGGNNNNRKEAERARKYRKGLILGQSMNATTINSGNTNVQNTHNHSTNTTVNAVFNPTHRPHTHHTTHTTTATHTTQRISESPSSYSPHFLSRAASESSSDADFYQGQYPSSRTTSIDHFFTFAAPNLNLSRIGGSRDVSGNAGNAGSYGGSGNSSGGVAGSGSRSLTGSLTNPAHIQHTVNATSNNSTITGTSLIAASPHIYRPVSENMQSYTSEGESVYRNKNDPPSPARTNNHNNVDSAEVSSKSL